MKYKIVLVIDDDRERSSSLEKALSHANGGTYVVCAVNSCEAALPVLTSVKIQAMVLKWRLLGAACADMFFKMKHQDFVLVCTGSIPEKLDAQQRGVKHFLVEPAAVDQVAAVVAVAIC